LGSVLQLVHQGRISLPSLVERMTVGPAKALGPAFADLATLGVGTPADIVLFDPDLDWVVDTSAFESKGRNTPLQGTPLKGRVMMTLVAGEVVYQDKGRWPEADAQ
ncbi:MAG: amidohydrolase family protein, partial [Chloroflexi bacterium]|nr:amidohydrolase family protein [Chloroflexota bacterium]